MDFATIASLISSIGFPIVCALVMGWFIWQIYKRTTADNLTNMERVQARCKEREDKLYLELEKSREINSKAIETIAHYAEKLDHIQQDISEIKSDIIVLTTRVE